MADGRTVRYGLLYRSGGLHLLLPRELEIVKQCGIVTIVDLRAKYEWTKKPDPEIGAVHGLYDGKIAKGGEKIDFSARGFSRRGQGALEQLSLLKEYYRQMPFDNSGFQAIMDALKNRRVPLLFHCTTGKDRTGIAAMVILYLLGAEDDVIMEDFLLTNVYRKKAIDEFMSHTNLLYPEDKGYCRLTFMRGGVDEEMGLTALRELHLRYDSPIEYAKDQYGWSKEDLESFRNDFLTE